MNAYNKVEISGNINKPILHTVLAFGLISHCLGANYETTGTLVSLNRDITFIVTSDCHYEAFKK